MKTFWIVLGVLAAAGVLLMAVGLFLGAATNLAVDNDGVHFGDGERQRINETGLGEISGLDIQTTSARVEIISAARAGLTIDCDRNPPVTWSLDDGVLKVRQGYTSFWQILSLNFGFHRDVIQVYLPEDVRLDRVKIAGASGSVAVSALNCRTFDVTVASGKVTADKITAEDFTAHSTSGSIVLTGCGADRMRLSITSGSLKGSGIRSGEMWAHTTSGTLRLEGKFLGENTIEVTSGSCVLDVAGFKRDYSRYISVTSGSVRVNGIKTTGNDTDTGAPNTLRVKVISGSAQIRFGED